MATGAIVLLVASAAASAAAAIKQGQDQAAAAKYNAQVASNDATMVQQQAQLQAAQDERETSIRRGTIEANQGASGGSLSGSSLDVLGDVTTQSNLQTNTDLYTGNVAAYKYKTDQQVDQFQGSQAIPNSILNAGGALLSGGSNAALAYSRLKNPSNQGNSLSYTG